MGMNPLSRNMAQPKQGPRGTTPNQDLNALLAQMSMPGAPGTGLNSGLQVPTLPSMQAGGPPTAQMGSQASKQRLANAMTQQAAGQLAQTGSPTGSAVGGAMQGASLAHMLTGKSPTMGAADKLADLMSPSPVKKLGAMSPDQAGYQASQLADKITGDAAFGPGNPGPFADPGAVTPAVPEGGGMPAAEASGLEVNTAMGADQNQLAQFMDPAQLETALPGADSLAEAAVTEGATELGAEVAADAGIEMGTEMVGELAVETAMETAAAELAAEVAAEAAVGSTGYGLPLVAAYEIAKALGFKIG